MKIFAIGRNYSDHAKEMKSEVPKEPVFFLKPESALIKNNKPFFYPDFSKEIHYELEVVVRFNRLGKNIDKKFAHRYYDGIALGIDLTARDLQRKAKEKGLPWEVSKAFDGSAPISEFIPVDQITDIQDVNIRLEKNGEVVQQVNTKDMIFPVEQLIEHVSRFITIKIGDLMFTGTPSGVGPVQIGDRLTAFLEDQKMLDFEIK